MDDLFGRMESRDVAGVLQERGNADSRACTRSHLCQGHHGHCIVTSSDKGIGRLRGGSFILGFGLEDRGWVYFFYFLFCFCAVVNCSFMAGT